LDLDIGQYKTLIQNACIYCGGELDRYGCGLDRLDGAGPYAEDNVVPSCGVCNHVRRGIFTLPEMMRIGAVIAQIREERARAGGPPLLRDYGPRTGRPKLDRH
jgi:hypothetical protein